MAYVLYNVYICEKWVGEERGGGAERAWVYSQSGFTDDLLFKLFAELKRALNNCDSCGVFIYFYQISIKCTCGVCIKCQNLNNIFA